MKVIGIAGRRLSGKNLAAEYISEKFGFRFLEFTGDVLAPLLKEENKPVTRENLARLAMSLREGHGTDVLTKKLCGKISEDGKYVISGVRFREEVEYLRNRFGKDFTLMAVECNSRARYKRARKRRDKGEARLEYEEFMEMESLPTEKVIPETMRLADCTLENNGKKKDLYLKINKIMESIL